MRHLPAAPRVLALALATVSLAATAPTTLAQTPWHSAHVFPGADGFLQYAEDDERNRIPDFSHAGAYAGERAIPDVPAVDTIGPVPGDNTAHLQAAFDAMADREPGIDGFRGAIFLRPGVYRVNSRIEQEASGVVIRGSGSGLDSASATILRAEGPDFGNKTVLEIGGGRRLNWKWVHEGTESDIIDDFVPVGSNRLRVADPSLYEPDQRVVVVEPMTKEWRMAHENGGGDWLSNRFKIRFLRTVDAIRGDTLVLDAPLFLHLDRSLAQSYVVGYDDRTLAEQVGVEDLRIQIVAADSTLEDHAQNALEITEAENSWARRVAVTGFSRSGVHVWMSRYVTVEDSESTGPVSEIRGGRRYNFEASEGAQFVLFQRNHAEDGRHHYVVNGQASSSGIVFLRNTSSGAYEPSEPHREWSSGVLYDNHRELDGPREDETPILLGLHNRGLKGGGHGWSGVHSVLWNCDVADGYAIAQKPPLSQNYAIGCSGAEVTGASPPAWEDSPEGVIEGANTPGLEPESLYEAQLSDRLRRETSTAPPSAAPLPTALIEALAPNPLTAQGWLDVRAPRQGGRVTVRLYDALGRALATLHDADAAPGALVPLRLDARALPAGMYFVRVTVGARTETRAVVVAR